MNTFDNVLLCPDSHHGVNVVALNYCVEGLLGTCRAAASFFIVIILFRLVSSY